MSTKPVKKWAVVQPEPDIPTARQTIKKENIAKFVAKQGGGLALLAQVAKQGIPGRAKHRAPEQVVEGEGKAAVLPERTEADLERERQKLVEATGGKQKTLLAMLPVGANVADLRANLKKSGAPAQTNKPTATPPPEPVKIIPPPPLSRNVEKAVEEKPVKNEKKVVPKQQTSDAKNKSSGATSSHLQDNSDVKIKQQELEEAQKKAQEEAEAKDVETKDNSQATNTAEAPKEVKAEVKEDAKTRDEVKIQDKVEVKEAVNTEVSRDVKENEKAKTTEKVEVKEDPAKDHAEAKEKVETQEEVKEDPATRGEMETKEKVDSTKDKAETKSDVNAKESSEAREKAEITDKVEAKETSSASTQIEEKAEQAVKEEAVTKDKAETQEAVVEANTKNTAELRDAVTPERVEQKDEPKAVQPTDKVEEKVETPVAPAQQEAVKAEKETTQIVSQEKQTNAQTESTHQTATQADKRSQTMAPTASGISKVGEQKRNAQVQAKKPANAITTKPHQSVKEQSTSKPSLSINPSDRPTRAISGRLSNRISFFERLSASMNKRDEDASKIKSPRSETKAPATPTSNNSVADKRSLVMSPKPTGNILKTPLAQLDAQAPPSPDYKVNVDPNVAAGGAYFSYNELLKKPINLDRTRLEAYLSDEEFAQVFAMSKEQFYALPKWRQIMLKKEKKLF